MDPLRVKINPKYSRYDPQEKLLGLFHLNPWIFKYFMASSTFFRSTLCIQGAIKSSVKPPHGKLCRSSINENEEIIVVPNFSLYINIKGSD